VFGVVALSADVTGARQIRRDPVVATLNDSGVTFRRHGPVGWEVFREVHLGMVKPRLLFALRPLHYIAFLPARTAGLPRPRPRERLAMRMYGTTLLLMTETVTQPPKKSSPLWNDCLTFPCAAEHYSRQSGRSTPSAGRINIRRGTAC
jgi:hypothetical protein